MFCHGEDTLVIVTLAGIGAASVTQVAQRHRPGRADVSDMCIGSLMIDPGPDVRSYLACGGLHDLDGPMDLSRFDAVPLKALTATTKEADYGTETVGRISQRCRADRDAQRASS